ETGYADRLYGDIDTTANTITVEINGAGVGGAGGKIVGDARSVGNYVFVVGLADPFLVPLNTWTILAAMLLLGVATFVRVHVRKENLRIKTFNWN
ncbi:MAG: hypothetical protein K1Y02_24065, partial [Candidatus Hydrogenedentes bacterium]|nr:hypothetical protein [Candidatus Hydrogenedentota bacterium]